MLNVNNINVYSHCSAPALLLTNMQAELDAAEPGSNAVPPIIPAALRRQVDAPELREGFYTVH